MKLEAVWNSLPLASDLGSDAKQGLGYRGSAVHDGRGRRWWAYKGVVTFSMPSVSERRLDEHGVFENLILASAPLGLLPPYAKA
jgi:hypothetical protein